MNAAVGRSEFTHRRGSKFGHVARSADINPVMAGGRDDPLLRIDTQLLCIDAAIEHRHILILTREHMEELETVEVAVFQFLQFLAEHDRVRGAVSVDQGNLALRLLLKNRRSDRQHRRDARSRRDQQIIVTATARRNNEPALRRHYLEHVARFQRARKA